MGYGNELVMDWYALPRKATSSREGWVYINLPRELADKVDAFVNSQKEGYRSRSEFVSDAVRRRLEEFKALSK